LSFKRVVVAYVSIRSWHSCWNVVMILIHVVSADVVRYKNDSTRCSKIRAPAQYIAFKKSKSKNLLTICQIRKNAKSSTW